MKLAIILTIISATWSGNKPQDVTGTMVFTATILPSSHLDITSTTLPDGTTEMRVIASSTWMPGAVQVDEIFWVSAGYALVVFDGMRVEVVVGEDYEGIMLAMKRN